MYTNILFSLPISNLPSYPVHTIIHIPEHTLRIPAYFHIGTYSYILSHPIITQSCNKTMNPYQYYESVFINKYHGSIIENYDASCSLQPQDFPKTFWRLANSCVFKTQQVIDTPLGIRRLLMISPPKSFYGHQCIKIKNDLLKHRTFPLQP